MNQLILLQNAIDRADQCYYNQNNRGGITDAEYDAMKRQLRGLNPTDERLSRVGAPISKTHHRKVIKHARLIGSLNDAMTEAEFRAWWPGPCMASLKMDGLTLENTYVDGVLVTAATLRGDGTEGEDVTANAVQVHGLPRQLQAKFSGNVRGEVYMRVSDLERVNKILAGEGEEPYANVRNAASGIIRSDDGRFSDCLRFEAHGIADPKNSLCIDRHFRAYQGLTLLGFTVVENRFCETVVEAIEYHTLVAGHRPGLDFWIDGVVYLVNDLDAFQAAGVVNKRPKGGIAFKFPAEEAITTLKDVVLTVGHTGKIIPTAVLEPVEIGSTTVSSALLNNWEEIARLGVVRNDKVVVIKAGDIIPKIIRVAERFLDGCANDRRAFEICRPTQCPVCGGKVAKNANTSGDLSADLYCQNPECDAKASGKIARWIKSLDIKGIGDEVLVALTQTSFDTLRNDPGGGDPDTKIVMNVADLYRLKEISDLGDLIINGKKLGKKRAASIVAEIEKTCTLTIDQFLGSLGVKHLGKRRVQLIRKAWCKNVGGTTNPFDSVNNWFSTKLPESTLAQGRRVSGLVTMADALGIPGIAGEVQADLDSKQGLIRDLLRHITITVPEAATVAPTAGVMAGKTFAFTGFRPDDDLSEKIKAAGGVVADDLTKTCTHLVQADASKESGKTKKAKGWGLEVIGKDQLLTMLAA